MRQVKNSTKDPSVVYLSNPIEVDRVIQTMQQSFATMDWLQKAFGRAYTLSRKNPKIDEFRSNDNIFFPAVFQGTDANDNIKDFEDLLVNDNLDSYCFFITTGDEEIEDEYADKMTNRFKRNISAIFWFDLDRINKRLAAMSPSIPPRLYPFQEELNNEIKEKISSTVFQPNDSVNLIRVIDDPRRIFQEFTIDIVDVQNLTYPSMGYRYDLEVFYNQYCS